MAVCGPGGMGKTALAAQAVDKLYKLEPDRFPDGIVSHTFYHQPQTDMALQSIAKTFDIKPEPTLEAAVRIALAGKKILLFLDGTEEADDLKAVRDDLRSSTWSVLITSRKRTDAQKLRLDLKPLENKVAEDVFCEYSGSAADDSGVQGICKILDGWPVGLRIAGRYLCTTGESTADYLRWLEKEPFKKLVEADGRHQEENATLLLQRSVSQVSKNARLALGIIGALALAPFAEGPIVALLKQNKLGTWWNYLWILKKDRRTALLRHSDKDISYCQNALNELVNYGLLLRTGECWQISHALIHTFARVELTMKPASLKQLTRYYIQFCYEQSEGGLLGYVRLKEEQAHYLHVIESCSEQKMWKEVIMLVRVLYNYLDLQGYWVKKQAAVKLALNAAKQRGSRKDQAWCLNELGVTCKHRGEYTEALDYYEQSIPIYREIGDKQGEGVTLNNIALVMYYQQGDNEKALQYYEQSLAIRREIGDRGGEGAVLANIGVIYSDQDNDEKALQYLEESLKACREGGNKKMEGTALGTIGSIYYDRGETAKGLEYMVHGFTIFQEIGDKNGEAESAGTIGYLYSRQGRLHKAEEYMSYAVQIFEELESDKPSWFKYLRWELKMVKKRLRRKRRLLRKRSQGGNT